MLALDIGEVRIGVAISDPDRRVAVPAGTIRVAGAPQDLKTVAALVEEHGAGEVVVGHPLSLTGASGPAAKRAEEFARALGAFLGIPVHLQDERLSTVEAERNLKAAGASAEARRKAVDQAAATLILRTYLDRSEK